MPVARAWPRRIFLRFISMAQREKLVVPAERLPNKMRECAFFLGCMEQHLQEPEVFGYYLSAFLSALKSIEYLTRSVGKDAAKKVKALRQNNRGLDFLFDARDVEVHREGVAITMTIGSRIKPPETVFRLPRSRFETRYESRFGSRFVPRWVDPVYQPLFSYGYTWQFADYPGRDIIALGRDCLAELKKTVADHVPA